MVSSPQKIVGQKRSSSEHALDRVIPRTQPDILLDLYVTPSPAPDSPTCSAATLSNLLAEPGNQVPAKIQDPNDNPCFTKSKSQPGPEGIVGPFSAPCSDRVARQRLKSGCDIASSYGNGVFRTRWKIDFRAPRDSYGGVSNISFTRF